MNKWKPPSLSELTPMIFDMGLTHLGLEATKSIMKLFLASFHIKHILLFYSNQSNQSNLLY